MECEQRVADHASRHHALITRPVLLDLGLTRRMVASRVARGIFEEVHDGAYRIGGSVRTFEQNSLAACLAIGGLVGASHRAAAELFKVELPVAPIVEATVEAARHPTCRGVVIHRSADLTRAQLTRVRGVPATSPLRLLVDLGAVGPTCWVEDALDDLLGRRVISIAGVRATLEGLAVSGRRGDGQLRSVLDRRVGNERHMSRSRLEAIFVRLASPVGLPTQFQYPVMVDGHRRRIDFAFPAAKVAIEVDGYESHVHWGTFQDDRVRRNALELAGWMVLQFTWHQLTQRPDDVVRVIAEALAAR